MRIQILILWFKGLSLVIIRLENPRLLAILLFPGYPKFWKIMKTQRLKYPQLFRMVGDKLVELETFLFSRSLRSRCLEVVGTRKNGHEKETRPSRVSLACAHSL